MSFLVTSNQLFGDSFNPIAANTIENRPLTQHELHWHEFYEIVYVVKGKLKHELSTDHMTLLEGDILLLKPYVRHVLQSDAEESEEVLAYCCSFLPKIVDSRFVGIEDFQKEGSMHRYFFLPFLPLVKEDISAVRTHVPREFRGRVTELMETILNTSKGTTDASRAKARCGFLELLVTLSDIYSKEADSNTESSSFVTVSGARYNEGLRRALNYMHEHLSEAISLNQMAQMSGVSVSYFSVMIKQATGMSFLKYLNGLRMDQARCLLRETNEKITDICYKLGYNDYSHFSRKFKKATGKSPREFRAEK